MKMHNTNGNGNSTGIGTRKRYTPEFKAQIVRQMLREEKSIAQLAAEYGIHPHQLYHWRDTALQALPSLFSDQSAKEAAAREEAHSKQVHDLYAQIGKLTTQLEWLKRTSAHSMSRETRIGLLERETSVTKVVGLSLLAQTQLLGLNRTSLYYRPAPPTREELAIKRRVDEIYTAHLFYGIRCITAQLHQEGVVVNHKAVARHMREMGLFGIAPGPATSRGSKRASDSKYPYLLKGVVASYPNHVWGIDITYIRLSDGSGSWL